MTDGETVVVKLISSCLVFSLHCQLWWRHEGYRQKLEGGVTTSYSADTIYYDMVATYL